RPPAPPRRSGAAGAPAGHAEAPAQSSRPPIPRRREVVKGPLPVRCARAAGTASSRSASSPYRRGSRAPPAGSPSALTHRAPSEPAPRCRSWTRRRSPTRSPNSAPCSASSHRGGPGRRGVLLCDLLPRAAVEALARVGLALLVTVLAAVVAPRVTPNTESSGDDSGYPETELRREGSKAV